MALIMVSLRSNQGRPTLQKLTGDNRTIVRLASGAALGLAEYIVPTGAAFGKSGKV
jgi:hypothetical protein